MRILQLYLLGTMLLSVCGCQQNAYQGDTLKTTAPINNNAPEAKNAPAAPRDPSILGPGGGGKKTRPGN